MIFILAIKNWGFWAISGRECSLVQSFCESSVHFDFAHLATHMIQRFVIHITLSQL